MYELSPRQEILRDDIRGLIKGEVRCDDVSRQIYSTDAGILQCRPAAVVYPRCVEDVSSLVRFASERHIPLHIRGAGTGRSGESLGSGIVIDFTRFMKKITALDYEYVAVQPGISRSRLNYTLYRAEKRYFAPTGISPATSVGSILARNGAGAYYLRDGFPAEHLLGMTVVLANGSVLTLNRDNLPFALDTSIQDNKHRRILSENKAATDFEASNVIRGLALARGIINGEEYALADNVHQILTSSSIGGLTPPSYPILPKVNRAGYCIEGVLNGNNGHSVDLTPLILGSEGTLALIVEAKLRTVPLPQRQGAAVLFFGQLEAAAQSVETILKYKPVLCELLDRRRLKMLREVFPKYGQLLPVESEAAVLIELNGGTLDSPVNETDIKEQLASLINELQDKQRLCFHSVRIDEYEMFPLFDQLINDSELILCRTKAPHHSIPLFDDTAVEPQYLPQYIDDVLKAVQRCGITCSLSGHIGQGHLRINPFMNSAAQDYVTSLRQLSEEVYSVVRQYNGTVSSEGAAGFLKTQYLPEQFGVHFETLRQIKNLFDPENILNPGKVIPDSAQTQREDNVSSLSDWTQYLRKGKYEPEVITSDSQLRVQLKWEPERFHETVYRCTGCGKCQRTEPDRTMRTCPVYRRFADEDSAPRSKCNLLRGILDKDIDKHINLNCLTSDRAKEVADRCIQCGMCSLECPSEVDIAYSAFRIKSAYNAAHNQPPDDFLMSHSDIVLKYLALFSYPVNWALKNKITRWLLEKTFHISQNRVFPPVSKITFLIKSRIQPRLSKPKDDASKYAVLKDTVLKDGAKLKVALFVDSYFNFFAPHLADAAVKILQHNEIEVFVPPKQKSCGMTAFLTGHSVRAEYLAKYNTLLLSDLIRQGYQPLTLEPAAAACVANNYRYFDDGINTALVSANITDFCTFLYKLHQQGKLKTDFRPVSAVAGYHAPCRLIEMTAKSINESVPTEQLLRLIPQLEVRRIERGCCGMSGIYGLKHQNHRHSLQIGLRLFRELKSEDIDFGISDCSSCLLQMRHGVPEKEMLHPIEILAAGYGISEADW